MELWGAATAYLIFYNFATIFLKVVNYKKLRQMLCREVLCLQFHILDTSQWDYVIKYMYCIKKGIYRILICSYKRKIEHLTYILFHFDEGT